MNHHKPPEGYTPKTKRKQFMVTFNDDQLKALRELMARYKQTSKSALLAFLIANDLNKKSVGRPKTQSEPEPEPDFTDDLPKKYHYYGRMIGKRELDWIDSKSDGLPQQFNG